MQQDKAKGPHPKRCPAIPRLKRDHIVAAPPSPYFFSAAPKPVKAIGPRPLPPVYPRHMIIKGVLTNAQIRSMFFELTRNIDQSSTQLAPCCVVPCTSTSSRNSRRKASHSVLTRSTSAWHVKVHLSRDVI